MEHKIMNASPDAMKLWEDFLPLGNGRLGAMDGGYPFSYTISLNEDSLWYGSHQERLNPDARENVEKIRELLRQGRAREAEKLCYMALTSVPKYFGAYEPMGQLAVFYNHGNEVCNYKRELNLETAIATVSYCVDGMKIVRESFVSYPDQVMVFRISADKPLLDMHVSLMRRPCDEGTVIPRENVLQMHGQCGPNGVSFDCMMSAVTDGEMKRIGDFLSFEKATEIVLYVTANSDFYEKDPAEKSLQQLLAAMEYSYQEIRERHIKDFGNLYHRVCVELDSDPEKQALPIEKRLDKARNGEKDKGLLELMFNYGRYLMISASRPGSQAMNLQGIWNAKFAPPWECNYTVNINTEMNYWIAEPTGLSECHDPLFTLIERMVPNGEKTAREMYGCEGFVSHHCTNLWGDTAVEGFSFPSSVWPVGGAWLSLHLWDHFLYTGNKEFLAKRAFPILQKACRFFMQYMTEAEDGYLVTGPSLSPENVYITDMGERAGECMGPEMDNQIVRALFRSTMRACEVLGYEDQETRQYAYYISKIRPTRINKNGCIMEWDKDYEEAIPGHRHLSPLFGLYPDYQITVDKTPDLAEACANTLYRRLENAEFNSKNSGTIGWVNAWASCCYSRLGMAEKAEESLYDFFADKKVVTNSMLQLAPILQVEGNFGVAAAVLEMLLQSDEEKIHLLPALPVDLQKGSFRGLRTRRGFVVDLQWEGGKPVYGQITSINGEKCRVKAPGLKSVNTACVLENDMLSFSTKAGETYSLQFE